MKLTRKHVYIHPTENKDRQFDNVDGLFVFSGPFHVFVVGVLRDNMQKPDDLTAVMINTLSPNEVLMSD